MNDLIQVFKHFLTRDAVFVTGGASILLSFSHCFFEYDPNKLSTYMILYCVAISYIIGYVLQELFSVFRIVRTSCANYMPGTFIKTIYKLFSNDDWPNEYKTFKHAEMQVKIRKMVKDDIIGEYQRIIFLKQIGTTIGPCLSIVSLIYLYYGYNNGFSKETTILFLGSAILSVSLIAFGWVKLAEQCLYSIIITESPKGAELNNISKNEEVIKEA